MPSPNAATELPRILTLPAATALGLTRSAVRHAIARRGWQRLAPGVVLTTADPPTRDDWAQTGLAITGPGAALSGWDALRPRGVGSPRPPVDEVLILDGAGEHRRVGALVIRPTMRPYRRSLLPGDHPSLPYVALADAARAAADAALAMHSARAVRALVTSVVQRGLCTPDELEGAYRSGPSNGSHHLRAALDDVLAGVRSVAESDAAHLLWDARVAAFELNVPVTDAGGGVVAVADALWRELRAVLEIDSREFHFAEDDWKQTMRRHNQLTALGFAVAHYAPSDIRAGGRMWAAEVDGWLRARAAELGLPYRRGPAGGRTGRRRW